MKKDSRRDIPLSDQIEAWNLWNASTREKRLSTVANEEGVLVEGWIRVLNRNDLRIIDVGCGVGWMSERLVKYGKVTGVDLADEVLARARLRIPEVEFIAGSIFDVPLNSHDFDVVVTLSTLPHVADQHAFMDRLADLLKPGGILIIATQNRFVLERWSGVPGPPVGQIRRWVSAAELRHLLARCFIVQELTSLVPVGDEGWLRLVNSQKVNWLLGRFIPPRWIKRMKERALLGHSLMLRAVRK